MLVKSGRWSIAVVLPQAWSEDFAEDSAEDSAEDAGDDSDAWVIVAGCTRVGPPVSFAVSFAVDCRLGVRTLPTSSRTALLG